MSRMRAYFFKMKSRGAKELLRECRFLWRYVCRYRGAVCVYILLGILGVAAGLLPGFFRNRSSTPWFPKLSPSYCKPEYSIFA